MARLLSLVLLLALSTVLQGSRCGEDEALSLEELRGDVAPAFSYALYCEPSGKPLDGRAATLLVRRSAHLERVYADAQAGDRRAQVLFSHLEVTVQRTGEELAELALGLVCNSLPACTVKWRYLDEVMPSHGPGGTRLRTLLANSFAHAAKRKGVKNAALTAALDMMLVGSVLKPLAAGAAETRAGTAEARAGTAEGGRLTREAILERMVVPGVEGRLGTAEVAALEARLAEAEALEVGARHPARLEILERHRPALSQPPRGVAADNPRWRHYVAYWEGRHAELAGTRPVPAGRLEVKPPLTWESYAALLGKFQQALEFQRGVARALQQEAQAAEATRQWLRGLRQPLVAENVGLAREGSASLTYVDQLVVDEATLRQGLRPAVHSFSNKQHDFLGKGIEDARAQLRMDIREALTKYGGTVEVRRPGHPLFERQVNVSRVHLVYDGTRIAADAREALSLQANRLGVELHFHAP